jgi:enoyl-CoA hydratase/carnithine racemase
MSYATVEKSGPVSTVTLNRPERLNAISGDLLDDLHDALTEVNMDEGCKVIVFTGAGRAFCAGDDLKEFGKQTENDASIRSHVSRIQQITRDLMLNGKPVVGAMHGFAVGGGFEWLLNCDLVLASEELVCFFPEMEWGQFVTGGVTWLLPQSVGHQRAMELWLLGERQTAQHLYELGLVNRVVERERVLEAALEVASRIAGRSTFSISRLKRLLTSDLTDALVRSLELEEQATVAAFATPEAAQRVRAFSTRK